MNAETLEQIDPTGLAGKLKASLDIDDDGAIAFLEEDRQRFNRGLDVAKQQRDEKRVQAIQARLAETEKRLAELRSARGDALDKARELEPDPGDETSPLSQAMADLRTALDEAAKAPKLFDTNIAGDALVSTGGLDGLASQVDSASRFTSQGTFSAATVFGLAAGGVNDRAKKAAEATAENTQKLVNHARRRRLVFG